MLDAITSFEDIVVNIGDNSNKLKQGASMFAIAGPGNSNFLLEKLTGRYSMKWKFDYINYN